MTALRVLSATGRMLVVDGGRQHGGAVAADDRALAIANAAVGNRWSVSAIEVLLGPCVLQADGEVVVGVCANGEGDVVRRANGADEPIDAFVAVTLQRGDELRLARALHGVLRLVAVGGGLVSPSGRDVAVADVVVIAPTGHSKTSTITPMPTTATMATMTAAPVRVVAGGERAMFDDAAWQQLLATTWRVSTTSNRRGVRLDGDALPLSAATTAAMAVFVTTPMWTGAVQVTPSGAPVILGADSRTTGGYARLAQVVMVDRWRLGQLRPGASVRLALIELDEARALHRAWEARWQT